MSLGYCQHIYQTGVNEGKYCSIKPRKGKYCWKHRKIYPNEDTTKGEKIQYYHSQKLHDRLYGLREHEIRKPNANYPIPCLHFQGYVGCDGLVY